MLQLIFASAFRASMIALFRKDASQVELMHIFSNCPDNILSRPGRTTFGNFDLCVCFIIGLTA